MKSSEITLPALKELQDAIRKGANFSLVVIGGSEEFLIDSAKELLLEHLLRDASREFDYVEVEAAQIDGKELWSQLVALPMFGKRRVIVLHDPAGTKQAAVHQALELYAQRPSESTSLVIVQPMDRKPAGYDPKAKGSATSFLYFALNDRERAKFVKDYVAACGKKIEEDAALYLVESSAAQLRDLASKLDHLVMYCGESATIQAADALKVTGVTSEVAPFGLDDAILKGDASRVLEEARAWVDGGAEPLAMLGRLRAILQRVWVIGGMDARQAPQSEMEQALGGQKWKLQEFRNSARRIGRQRIEDSLLSILQIEIAAKSKPVDVVPQIYGWLWALCNPVHRERAGTSSRLTAYVR